MKIVVALLTLALVIQATTFGYARERFAGEYDNIDPSVRSWFKNVRSPHGVPCCDISDGHRTSYDMRPDNHYWVPIEGEWRQVPSEAVVYNSGNPVGEAIVWYVMQSPGAVYIRCFVPGGGV